MDFLHRKSLKLSRPGFESLRSFDVHEIDMTTSDYAQAFFKDEKDSSLKKPINSRELRVYRVTAGVENSVQDDKLAEPHLFTSSVRPGASSNDKSSPKCFVCSHSDCKRFWLTAKPLVLCHRKLSVRLLLALRDVQIVSH